MVVLIHGLGSNTEKTWDKFPMLLAENSEIAKRYSTITSFSYETSKTGQTCSLTTISTEFANWLQAEVQKSHIDEIVFVTHSQGGLLARRYLCNELIKKSNLATHTPIFRLLTFATPHWGAYSENASSFLPDSWQQQKNLAYDSEFILSLNKDWAITDAEYIVRVKRVAGGDDKIVPEFSSTGANYNHDYVVIPGHGHVGFVKISDTSHPAFEIAKEFLLEETSEQPLLVNPDRTPPVLSCGRVKNDQIQGNARFLYVNRYIPLLGRDDEKTQLEKFLFSPAEDNVVWMFVKGQGGIGKSRLALELCMSIYTDWHAGFLDRYADTPDWARWQPYLPTLLVIDNAITDIAKLSRLLQGLCNRDEERRLRRPVRILLLDRPHQEDKLQVAFGHDPIATRVKECRAPDIDINKTADPWGIIEHFMFRMHKPIPEKVKIIDQLTRIDPEKRPLFAMLLADAIGQNEKVETLTQKVLLENVIREDREKYWRPAAKEHGVSLAKMERLLTVATLVNGLAANNVVDPIEEWDRDSAGPVFKIMSGYDEQSDTIAPLIPDFLGECFALESFKSFNKEELKKILTLAWHQWGRNTFAFFNRVVDDFPNDTYIDDAIEAVLFENVGKDAWSNWAVNLIAKTGFQHSARAERAYEKLALLAATHPWLIRELAQASCNMIRILGVEKLDAAINIFEDLCRLVRKHSTELEISALPKDAQYSSLPYFAQAAERRKFELWPYIGKAAKNLMIAFVLAKQSSAAKNVYKDLCSFSAVYAGQAEVSLIQALAARDLIGILHHVIDRVIIMHVFRELCMLADRSPSLPYIRFIQVDVALNYIFANDDEPEIRFIQAKAAVDAIPNLAYTDPEAAKTIFINLTEMARAYPDEEDIYVYHQLGIMSVTNLFRTIDPAFALAVSNEYGESHKEVIFHYLCGKRSP
ncbi:alpha/beta fold hydrolase [Undibacterium sp. Ji83W]|uniref:alpha/beta fold hydrolase n=1 Tax=Undibacterium sp. Ji83W TaxID=3413043 RepID=UPI003BF25681